MAAVKFGALEQADEIIEGTKPNWDERDPTLGFMSGVQAVSAALQEDLAEAKTLAQKSRDSINQRSLNPEFLGYATLLQAEMLILEQNFRERVGGCRSLTGEVAVNPDSLLYSRAATASRHRAAQIGSSG